MKLLTRSRIPVTIGLTLALAAAALVAAPQAAQAEEFVPSNDRCDSTGLTAFTQAPLQNGGETRQIIALVSLNTCDAKRYAQYLIRKALELETPKKTIETGATILTFVFGIAHIYPLAAGSAALGFSAAVPVSDAQTKLRILANLVDDYNNNQCGKRGIQFKADIKDLKVVWSDMRCQPGPTASLDGGPVFDPTADYVGDPGTITVDLVTAPHADQGESFSCSTTEPWYWTSPSYYVGPYAEAYLRMTYISDDQWDLSYWNPDTGIYETGWIKTSAELGCTPPPPPADPPCPSTPGATGSEAGCQLPADVQYYLHTRVVSSTENSTPVGETRTYSLSFGATLTVETEEHGRSYWYEPWQRPDVPANYVTRSTTVYQQSPTLAKRSETNIMLFSSRLRPTEQDSLVQSTWWVDTSSRA